MKKLRVLLLMHPDLVPPDNAGSLSRAEIEVYKTEWDVLNTLRKLGHEVQPLGLWDELAPIKRSVEEFQPHVAFNLLEEFLGQAVLDQNVVSYLELLQLPYTGCNPRGLILARDKALGKKICTYHRIAVPLFQEFPLRRKIRRRSDLPFPLIVKSLVEEASLGISQASIVENDEKLKERVEFIHEKLNTDAIAEQYIEGREIYACVMGNQQLSVLPLWELRFSKMPEEVAHIATRRVKWNLAYQRKHGILSGRAGALSAELEAKVHRVAKKIYRVLGLSGYARLDFRLDKDGDVYFLEANPNPQIAWDEEFAEAALAAGMSYEELLSKIVSIGLQPR